jgi:two-component system chemotaxis response regulator CheB
MTTRFLVVDDAALFRRVISEALAGVPGVEVAGTATNGKLALSRLASLHPDMMTLDIEMPEMNGIEVLEAMSAARMKVGVIVLSSRTVRGGQLTIRALELGAFDFITKPEKGSPEENLLVLRRAMEPIIRAFERRRAVRAAIHEGKQDGKHDGKDAKPSSGASESVSINGLAPGVFKAIKRSGPPVILIGVSTGGPSALAEVLPLLPATLNVPVFVVQHMPPLFTHALAERLQTKSTIRIKEAVDSETAVAACVYIAPGGKQMKLTPGPHGEIVIRITDDPPENNCKPSVDYLFRSVAQHFPGRAVAAILTGMGNDGAQGLKLLKRSGCSSIAQDEATCVVFGMPREAILAGVIDTIVPLNKIAETLVRCVTEVHV